MSVSSMCNAWNHPVGCTCGWGGENHLGSREAGSYFSVHPSHRALWAIPQTYESYVNPNASCPVCGAPVFFYQSPYGGRVFFDDLGPPWPKHPCTDHHSTPNSLATTMPNITREYSWQTDGWSPFFMTTILRIDQYIQKITETLEGEEISIYISSSLNGHLQTEAIQSECIAQARKTADQQYEVSIITTSGNVNTIKAYSLLSEIEKHQDEADEAAFERAKQDALAQNIMQVLAAMFKHESTKISAANAIKQELKKIVAMILHSPNQTYKADLGLISDNTAKYCKKHGLTVMPNRRKGYAGLRLEPVGMDDNGELEYKFYLNNRGQVIERVEPKGDKKLSDETTSKACVARLAEYAALTKPQADWLKLDYIALAEYKASVEALGGIKKIKERLSTLDDALDYAAKAQKSTNQTLHEVNTTRNTVGGGQSIKRKLKR